MASTRRNHPPASTEPLHLPDAFATSFEVQDFEDWLRIIGSVEAAEPSAGDGRRSTRWRTMSLVLPRSSLHGLITELRHSAGARNSQRRHN